MCNAEKMSLPDTLMQNFSALHTIPHFFGSRCFHWCQTGRPDFTTPKKNVMQKKICIRKSAPGFLVEEQNEPVWQDGERKMTCSMFTITYYHLCFSTPHIDIRYLSTNSLSQNDNERVDNNDDIGCWPTNRAHVFVDNIRASEKETFEMGGQISYMALVGISVVCWFGQRKTFSEHHHLRRREIFPSISHERGEFDVSQGVHIVRRRRHYPRDRDRYFYPCRLDFGRIRLFASGAGSDKMASREGYCTKRSAYLKSTKIKKRP